MLARYLQRWTNSKPIVGRGTEFSEKAVDHHLANSWWTANDALFFTLVLSRDGEYTFYGLGRV